jgi:hypothetical protein
MAIDHVRLDGEEIHRDKMPKRRFIGQPKRVIRTIVFENDGGALLPSRFVFPADCTPVNGYRIRGPAARRTGPWPRIYRASPLFFPVNTGEIQGIYRDGLAFSICIATSW